MSVYFIHAGRYFKIVDADEVTQLVHSLLIHRLALLDAR